MLVLTVLFSTISLAVGNAAATADSDNEADDTRPTVRITSPEKSPQKIVTITGPASGVNFDLEGTAFDDESGIDKVEVKVNDAGTLQLLRGYETAIATGPDGDGDFSTWSKKLTFDEEGTYRMCARATDEAGNPNWWHVLVKVEFDDKVANGKIAFHKVIDGKSQIYVINADGSDQTNLSDSTLPYFGDYDPTWSSDGTQILFGSQRDGYPEIYVMNADGTDQTRLTNKTGSKFGGDWSPDGLKIAYSSTVPTTEEQQNEDIFVMNADGTNQVNLTSASTFDENPDWSPDGTKIAFDNEAEIYIMNADGAGKTRLKDQFQPIDRNPSWSPDGAKIAFESNSDGNSNIYVVNADGTGQTKLTGNGPIDTTDLEPSWSPDGTKITFARFIVDYVMGGARYGHYDIFVMNADGTGATNLTNGDVDSSNRSPSWAPER